MGYDEFTFYQVDIDEYLKNTNNHSIYLLLNEEVPKNIHLKKAYFNCRAGYVEGEIAGLYTVNNCLLKIGGIDGDIYDFIKDNKEGM